MRRLAWVCGLPVVAAALWARGTDAAPGPRGKVLDLSNRVLVRVSMRLRTIEEARRAHPGRVDYFTSSAIEETARNRSPLVVLGMLVDPSGLVLTHDVPLAEELIAAIEVTDSTGTSYPARRQGVLADAAAMFLRLDAPSGKRFPCATFAPAPALGLGQTLYTSQLRRVNGEWQLEIRKREVEMARWRFGAEPYAMALVRGGTEATLSAFIKSPTSCHALVFNAQGEPIGWSSKPLVSDAADDPPWRGRQLLQARRIEPSARRSLQRAVQAKMEGLVHKAKVHFRQEETTASSSSRYTALLASRRASRRRSKRTELEAYGLAISSKRILVPQAITPDEAKRIEKVDVTVVGRTGPAKFAGAYRTFGGFVVELASGSLPGVAPLDQAAGIGKEHVFLSCTARHRFGKRSVGVRLNRWVYLGQGYGGLYTPVPAVATSAGCWLLDRSGNLAGFMAMERGQGDALSKYSITSSIKSTSSSPTGRPRIRPFWFSDIRPQLTNPDAHFDPAMVPVAKKERKRLVWLGVEYETLTKELAQSLGCEKPTRDGLMGLMVTRVYPGSPAAKTGLRENDILLSLVAEGKDQRPVSLSRLRFRPATPRAPSSRSATYRFWRPRKSRFTDMLTVLGAGTTATLLFLRDGHARAARVTLEMAPPDFDSASQRQDEALGLTVKDLTYEVRHGLNLAADAPGVILAKVESGSPAQLAQLRPYELLVSLDGGPIKSADDFATAVQKAKQAGKTTVRLLVTRLGESRFSDLKLSGK